MQVMDRKSWWVLIFNLRSCVCWVQEKEEKKITYLQYKATKPLTATRTAALIECS